MMITLLLVFVLVGIAGAVHVTQWIARDLWLAGVH